MLKGELKRVCENNVGQSSTAAGILFSLLLENREARGKRRRTNAKMLQEGYYVCGMS